MKQYKPNKKYQHAFAIIRIDTFADLNVSFENLITVLKIVWTREKAEQEVERLKKLNATKKCTYFWQVTRLEKTSLGQ